MKIKGLKKHGMRPEKVKTKNGWMETGETQQMYKAPDGLIATYERFMKDACMGILHGCIVSSD